MRLARSLVLFILSLLILPTFALAQLGGGTGGGGGAGGGGGFGGGGGLGGNNQNSSGVKIDPNGVMSLLLENDSAGQLQKKRRDAASKKSAGNQLGKKSHLRYVSLVQLEKELGPVLEKQSSIPDEIFYLAGLTRLEYVFVFPDEHDLVIAGPADTFVPDAIGRMIGTESGRPILRLDDLFVALRTLRKAHQLGCSIDPTPEGLVELRKFLQQGGPSSYAAVESRFQKMDEILGLQNVRIDGLPTDSHFASIVVEADYRMKRIAIGLENPQVKGMKSYLSTMPANGNNMQRWWFVPSYESISHDADGNAYQFVGNRAKLLTEEEVIDVNGNRSSSGTVNKSAQAFAKLFTEKFPEIAKASPVFAELQNLVDWSIFAALLMKERIPERIGWQAELLLDDQRLTHPVFATPVKVPSQVNYRRTANMVVGMVCGGVILTPNKAYSEFAAASRGERLATQRTSAVEHQPEKDRRWWWDAE